MMQQPTRCLRACAFGLAVATLGACTDPAAPRPSDAPELSTGYAASLLECPSAVTQTATGLIDPLLGGTVGVGGSSISIPGGAIPALGSLLPVGVTVTVPASKYVEVDIKVGLLDHFQFLRPVAITIDYGRCSRTDLDRTDLSAWYIDGRSKTLLEPMGGTDDKVNRRVTFQTDHLSGYALATSRTAVTGETE